MKKNNNSCAVAFFLSSISALSRLDFRSVDGFSRILRVINCSFSGWFSATRRWVQKFFGASPVGFAVEEATCSLKDRKLTLK